MNAKRRHSRAPLCHDQRMKQRSTPLLVANWKANLPPGEEVALAGEVAREAMRRRLKSGSLMIAPSALGLVPVASLLAREHPSLEIGVVAQDVSAHGPGAFTGEFPAIHLAGVAVAAIIGHSERRNLGESNALVGKKIAQAVAAGITPIICVGDSQRDATAEQRCSEVILQWEESLVAAAGMGCSLANLIDLGAYAAYEPVWAIGSGQPADAELAGQIAAAIRGKSSDRIQVLYGGSVRAEHGSSFLAGTGGSRIDGLLVGGASLTSDSLFDIAAALGLAT